MSAFDDEQIEWHSRHIILREVGGKGQRKLLDAKVLVVGAGGLGSPVGLYLAAAGVGTIGLADSDAVELSNLQRQVLHATPDLGRRKSVSAKESMEAINPDVCVVPHDLRLTSENILETIDGHDIVVDGSDNFPTRHLVNEACVMTGKSLSHAGILCFQGQVTTISPGAGPCYRCLYPEPPPPGLVPSCREAGVLGAVAGILGTIQAAEVLRLILGIEDLLVGRLLLCDALDMTFRELRFERDAACPVCGDAPPVTALIDYEEFCSLRGSAGIAEEARKTR